MKTTRVRKHKRRTKQGIAIVRKHERTLDLPSNMERRSPYRYTVHATITIPSTSDITQKISRREFRKRIKKAREKAIELFGGHTTVSGLGGWYSSDLKRNVEEDVAVIHIYAQEKDWLKNDQKLRSWLLKKKKEWGQESMAFTYQDSKRRFRSFLL